MGDIGQQVEAFSVPSVLMTRTYKSQKMLAALSELQACVKGKIGEIQDEPGTHPAWQAVDPSAEVLWDKVFKTVDPTVVQQP
jgi:hypothetical protein